MDGRYAIRDQTKMNCYDRVCDLGQWAERVCRPYRVTGTARARVVDFVQGVTSPSLTFRVRCHPVTPPPTTFTNLILLPVSAPRIQCRFVEPNRWTIAANQFGYASATLAPRSVSRYSLVVFTRMWTRHLFYQLDGWTTRFQETTLHSNNSLVKRFWSSSLKYFLF